MVCLMCMRMSAPVWPVSVASIACSAGAGGHHSDPLSTVLLYDCMSNSVYDLQTVVVCISKRY